MPLSRGLTAALGRDRNVLQRAGRWQRGGLFHSALSRTESSHSGTVATSKTIDDSKHRVSVAEAARMNHRHSQERPSPRQTGSLRYESPALALSVRVPVLPVLASPSLLSSGSCTGQRMESPGHCQQIHSSTHSHLRSGLCRVTRRSRKIRSESRLCCAGSGMDREPAGRFCSWGTSDITTDLSHKPED